MDADDGLADLSLPASSAALRWCSPCGREQPFEMPPCEDGHGELCLDLACVVCGAGIVLAGPVEEPVLVAVAAA